MKTVSLGDIVEIKGGGTPDRAVSAFWNGEVPWASVKDFRGTEIKSTLEQITRVGLASSASNLIPAGAVIVPTRMAVGKAAINMIDLAINQDLKALIPVKGVNCRFLLHKLLASSKQLEQRATGATVKGITLDVLRALPVQLPILEEQRRIAAILDGADALRAKRRAALAQLDEMAQAIFVEMFESPKVAAKNWPARPLSALVAAGDNINYGVIQPGQDSAEGVPLVRVGDLVSGRVCHANLRRIDSEIEDSYKRSRLKGDEILISCVGSIGLIALTSPEERGFNIARAVARVRVCEDVNREFVAAYLKTCRVQQYFEGVLRTVAQPTLNIKHICETKMIVPPKKLQDEFAIRVSQLAKCRLDAASSLVHLDTLFASLQHRAFTGAL